MTVLESTAPTEAEVQAAREAGLSRIYGGIHFVRAVEDGWVAGKRVGREVARKLPRSESTPPSDRRR